MARHLAPITFATHEAERAAQKMFHQPVGTGAHKLYPSRIAALLPASHTQGYTGPKAATQHAALQGMPVYGAL